MTSGEDAVWSVDSGHPAGGEDADELNEQENRAQ